MTFGQYLPFNTDSSLSADDIKLEFSTDDPFSLNDFYRGGSNVPDNSFYRNITSIPASGEISFRNFYKLNTVNVTSLPLIDSVNEGSTLVFTLTTTNSPDSAYFPYTVTGITDSDLFSGSLTGNFTIADDSSKVTFIISNDVYADGPETMVLTLDDLNISISKLINDTSINFENFDFSDTTIIGTSGTITNFNGWDIYSNRAIITGSSRTTIGGFEAPLDTTKPASAPTNPDAGTVTGMTYNYAFLSPTDLINGAPSGKSCVRLYQDGTVTADYGIVHGPYVVSADFIPMLEGQNVSFDWRAAAGDDAYDVFAYLLKDDGTSQILLDATQGSSGGDSGWLTVSDTIDADGNYKFVFISGSYDFTGGNALGASLYVTNISISAA